MAIPVLLICVVLWCIPLFKRLKKFGTVSKKRLLMALFLGLVPGTVLILLIDNVGGLIIEMIGNLVLKLSGRDIAFGDTLVYQFLLCFLIVALGEEGIKYLFGRVAVRKGETYNKLDYVALFGAVGLGYEISESVMYSLGGGGIMLGLLRGAFLTHAMWQFFMGAHYFESIKNGSKKEKRSAFFVPYIIHAVNDFMLEVADKALLDEASDLFFIIGLIAFVLAVALNVFNAVICYKTALKSTEGIDTPAQ